MAIAGKVAITPKGNWSASTAYTKLDLVFYDNASYVAIQPSTGVTPTNTAYWMLVVQSAGGADLEAIIDGSTPVGNALALDGHGAEYFLPKSGGTINGNVFLTSLLNELRVFVVNNSLRQVNVEVQQGGAFRLRDTTNSKDIINSTVDGTNTFNGTSSGNLPLDGGGTVSSNNDTPITLKSKTSKNVYQRFLNSEGVGWYFGFDEKGARIVGHGYLLHTGNKPTGTYTGNGSADVRYVDLTGAVGKSVCVDGNGYFNIVTPRGTFSVNKSTGATTWVAGCAAFRSNELVPCIVMLTNDGAVNASGTTYEYWVI